MSRNVFTIFSDDVRHEIGGKVSYIGVYAGKLLAASFPVVLPKLCLTLRITTPSSKPFQKLIAKIYKDDELIAEGELPPADLQMQSDVEETENPSSVKKLRAIQMGFAFAPFVIDEPCFIRVRVENEGKELRGTGLRVEKAPDGMILPGI